MTNHISENIATVTKAAGGAVDTSEKVVAQVSKKADKLITRAAKKTGKATKKAEKVAKKTLKKVNSTYRKSPGMLVIITVAIIAGIAAIVFARQKL